MKTVDAKQKITIDNITVLGIDLNNLINQFDNVLTATNQAITLKNMQPLSNSALAIQSVKNMQDIEEKAFSQGVKDYKQVTNLGKFQANIVMHNGVINSSQFNLDGVTIKSNGLGSVNLLDKSINYSVNTQIVTSMKNQILNEIIFPYKATGKLDNLQGGINWLSIETQIMAYLIKQTVTQTKAALKNEVNKRINNLNKNINPQLQQGLDSVKKGSNNIINNIFK
jgi:hypothetical protein